jgi:hypothetical protein
MTKRVVEHEIKLEKSVKIILGVLALGVFLNAFAPVFDVREASANARVYQNKCVNGIYKKLKNNLVAEPVGPVKNGFLFFTSP